ncbi:MAG: RNA polymerase subunit sigma-70 [Clostridia bacterium]|nr:RNA polymerase subunit sigma-70 [Clostridia bacterium]
MDKIYCGELNAYYGSVLNDHQREVLRLYYDCDMSLAEIAELYGTSRQAVREGIARSTEKLRQYEEKLGLIKKVKSLSGRLEHIIKVIDNEEKAEIKSKLSALLKDIKEI